MRSPIRPETFRQAGGEAASPGRLQVVRGGERCEAAGTRLGPKGTGGKENGRWEGEPRSGN